MSELKEGSVSELGISGTGEVGSVTGAASNLLLIGGSALSRSSQGIDALSA
jgi:hypothetical protein